MPRTNTKSQSQPVTAKYLYRGSTDRKLRFHETLLVLSNSASSPFTTGHQLKTPSLPVLQHVLLAVCYPSQRLHTTISRSTYRKQHRIWVLAYKAFYAMALPSFRTFPSVSFPVLAHRHQLSPLPFPPSSPISPWSPSRPNSVQA